MELHETFSDIHDESRDAAQISTRRVYFPVGSASE
jgi:hypothetical protein